MAACCSGMHADNYIISLEKEEKASMKSLETDDDSWMEYPLTPSAHPTDGSITDAVSEVKPNLNGLKDDSGTGTKFDSVDNQWRGYFNTSGAFATGVEILSEENEKKIEKRAERFGIRNKESFMGEKMNGLLDYFNIKIQEDGTVKQGEKKNFVFLNSLHLRGVNQMNTEEVLQYFASYGPKSVYWIDDFSCNIIFLDNSSAIRALVGLSKPIEHIHIFNYVATDKSPLSTSFLHDMSLNDVQDENQEKVCDMDVPAKVCTPVPPGLWRLGFPHKKSKELLLRFSNKDDKKIPGAEKRSKYYEKHGNPNYGGLRGKISNSRKRKFLAERYRLGFEESDTYILQKNQASSSGVSLEHCSQPIKKARMTMYADMEKKPNKNSKNVFSRLGERFYKEDIFGKQEEFESINEEYERTTFTVKLPRKKYYSKHPQVSSSSLSDSSPEEPRKKNYTPSQSDYGSLKQNKILQIESKHRHDNCKRFSRYDFDDSDSDDHVSPMLKYKY